MEALTGGISEIMGAALDWVSLVLDKISEEPLLLLAVLVPFVSLGISLLRKLLTVKSE